MKTILIDTNILVRYFVGDIKDQAEKAQEVFKKVEENKLKAQISILVINELVWILEHYYEIKREVYIPQIIKLLALKNLKITEIKKETLVKILKEMLKQNLDFTDLYLLQIKDNNEIFTFDKKLNKLQKK